MPHGLTLQDIRLNWTYVFFQLFKLHYSENVTWCLSSPSLKQLQIVLI